ncbi:Acyl-CoA-binding protein-like [Holothuria leucospilota]|uniref:Acyl-CoA-binding protein-like n=1 Tax=Holothuria leucospilota TaxID=206669 RepID=A0A9Q0YPI3_HOLLE|nr:Acyl-CoA-binding protein-like [Holothuria leucospilota]
MPSEEFNKAAASVRALTTKPEDSVMLELYGLYKQVTVGDCNIAEPAAGDSIARAKWEAWNRNKGKAVGDAEKQYITKASQLTG